MSDLLETLKCPNCGGKLTLVAETQRYRCDYCGNEHVARRDGLVYYGPDKIASEAALKRLTSEVAEAEAEIQKYTDAWEKAKVTLEQLHYTLKQMEGRANVLRKELQAARTFRRTRHFALISLGIFIPIFFCWALYMTQVTRPTVTGNWEDVFVSLVFACPVFLLPIGIPFFFFGDIKKIRTHPQAILTAEAEAERERPVLQEKIATVRATAAQYPAEKVDALRAEILDKKQQMALHYEVLNSK